MNEEKLTVSHDQTPRDFIAESGPSDTEIQVQGIMRAPLQLLFSPADQHEDVERRLHISYGFFQGPTKVTESPWVFAQLYYCKVSY